ncbi:outer membrane protein [Microvirga lotononidis]|uniref:Opacity protein n=1 Tax=Microvirga lotononidis TaxID=864069 RepID=I4YW75_9HYPH|nr:outer membrane beta-barrel protein [Microvirga lotononidis]EIM28217.1 opacity protein [Microvirga lotononidis]WQO27685.1 outer membrane beta-barrel protein [Microvirga lotononidis]
MKTISIAALTGLFAALSSAAMAADLSRVFVSSSSVGRDYRESARGLYLRGTVGYVDYKRPEADFADQPFTSSLGDESLNNAAVVGAGVGYRFNANVRADVTLDHTFDARFKGVVAPFSLTAVSIADQAQFESSTFMVNGYLDFRPVMGFTPYIGAGIGMAHNIFSRHVLATYDPATGNETFLRFAGGDDFSLAWALMAGVGYQLSSNFTLDLGYRYASLGSVKTRSYDTGIGVDMESIGAHEMRFGVRYSFN